MSSDLFRPEVLESHSKRAYGDVVLVHPVSHYALALLGLAMLAIVVAILIFGHYTRHATVPGVLEPVGGLVKVYASQTGTLKAANVREGQSVHKGDVLLVFASEHDNAAGVAIEHETEARAQERLDDLRKELQGTLALSQSDQASARDTLSALHSARSNLQAQIRNQHERIQAAESILARYEQLKQSGFMPDVQVQAKRDDLTDQRMRLQAMEKDLIANNNDIARVERDIATAPVKASVTRAQIERNIAGVEAELGMQQNAHEWAITAPCDGTVSGVAIHIGQSIANNTPLLTLEPSHAQLQATLYAPSRSLGFVKASQAVKMKLDAFPFQKFGLSMGHITQVAGSPVLPNEISTSTRLLAANDGNEPLYAISVTLDRQTMDAYGQAQPLRPGMLLSADIQLDTRHLYEWLLEPLYSVKRG